MIVSGMVNIMKTWKAGDQKKLGELVH